MALQPLQSGRWYAVQRKQAIRAIEKSHGSRVITMIHRQEKRILYSIGALIKLRKCTPNFAICSDRFAGARPVEWQ